MSDVMATIGRSQLSKINKFLEYRKKLALRYTFELKGLPDILLYNFNYETIFPHIFSFRVLNGKRNGLREKLNKSGIETGIHYVPNHLLTYFKTNYKLPNSEKLFSETISIPLHPDLTVSDQDFIVSQIKSYMN